MIIYRNRFLQSLTPAQQRLLGPLEPVSFRAGDYLYRFDQQVRSIIFLESGVLSLIRPLHDGRDVEIFTNGGTTVVVAVHTLFQEPVALYDYLARTEGWGWRVSREALDAAMTEDPAIRIFFQRVVYLGDSAIGQNIACRTVHSHEQRFARVLLFLREAVGDRINLPRATLAEMVPVRRPDIYRIAQPLLRAGVISFCNGFIDIHDEAALRAHGCGCFSAMAAMRNELFPG